MRFTSAKALTTAILVVFCGPILMQRVKFSPDTLGEHVHAIQRAPGAMLSATMDSELDAPTPIDADLLHALAACTMLSSVMTPGSTGKLGK
jgi:hypothetical protein